MSNFPDFSANGYEIESELGHNRVGGRVTYLATPVVEKQFSSPHKKVVIKQFQFARPESSWAEYEAYEQEIQVLQSLKHPGIPQYLGSFQTPLGFCMLQEYKPAFSLAKTRCWTLNEIKQIAISILEILVYLQDQRPPVIHRDIKPENILVALKREMRVYLVDFGFARMGGGEVAISSVVKGTLGFMPPEQLFNRQLTQASDLYGLGATLICLLTNTKSIEIGNLIDTTCRINFKHLVPQLSRQFVDWLQKMVAPNVKERYVSAAVALEALKSIDVNHRARRWSSYFPQKQWIPPTAAVLTTIALVGFGAIPLLKKSEFRVTTAGDISSQFLLSYQVTFTTNLNKYYKPANNLTQISMKQKRVYFYISFNLLSDKQYDASCQIIDGLGNVLYAEQSPLTAEGNSLDTWCFYDFNKQVNQPGDWRFEFYLDGQKVVSNNLTVLP